LVRNSPVSARILKRFIDKGGYDLLKSIGSGLTSEEKQLNGWQRRGIITQLAERTTIGNEALHKIKKRIPYLEISWDT